MDEIIDGDEEVDGRAAVLEVQLKQQAPPAPPLGAGDSTANDDVREDGEQEVIDVNDEAEAGGGKPSFSAEKELVGKQDKGGEDPQPSSLAQEKEQQPEHRGQEEENGVVLIEELRAGEQQKSNSVSVLARKTLSDSLEEEPRSPSYFPSPRDHIGALGAEGQRGESPKATKPSPAVQGAVYYQTAGTTMGRAQDAPGPVLLSASKSHPPPPAAAMWIVDELRQDLRHLYGRQRTLDRDARRLVAAFQELARPPNGRGSRGT